MKKCIKQNMVIKTKLLQRIRAILMCIVMVMIFQSICAQRIEWSLTPTFTEKESIDLRKRLMKGDTVAYYNYVFCYSKLSPECLPYALFMANNYHYQAAYYDVYASILYLYQDYDLEVDSISYSFAFQYLLKGAELGSLNCNSDLAAIYYLGNRFVPRDTVKAKEFWTKEYEDYDTKQREWDWFKRAYQKSIEAREERY